MELENLKEMWGQRSQEDFKSYNSNFMELIHDRNYGPVATLKNKFWRQITIFPLALCVIIYVFIKNPELLNNILMWVLVAVMFALAAFYWFNYTIVKKLQNTNSSVKESIEKNISTLENGFKKYLLARRILYVIFVIFLEILMYFHREPDYESWYSVSVYFRVLVYILGFFIIHFLAKFSYKKQFGQHISYLRDLLNKMN